jgi:multicomponent Na+:H+ antiporter subunit A
MELALLMAALFAVAAAAPFLHRRLGRWTGVALAAAPATLFLLLARHVPAVAGGAIVSESRPWLPQIGVDLALRLDGLGLLFALLITGIGALVVLYAGRYLEGHARLGRFYAFLLLFMASMLGVALADDLVSLFVFWELTSLSSYFLIGFEHENAEARRNALQALLVTGAGGLALLAGLILMALATGTGSLSGSIAQAEALRGDTYAPILLLVLLGAFTKSAQFPFHFWLPGAMVAPTPVSAYLHSATMVKAGVYLLARLQPGLGGTDAWTVTLAVAGVTTLLVGSVLALRQTDLKLILAYTTVAALGVMTLLVGLGTKTALAAAIVVLLAHALYKGALFLVAGAVDHGAGTRDLARLGGLRRTMPWTATAALLAGLSFLGLPPFLGFVAKEALLEAALHGWGGALLVAATVVGLALLVVAALQVAHRPFWGSSDGLTHPPHEVPPMLLAGPLLLASIGLAAGLAPAWVAHHLVDPAASAASGHVIHSHLALWHGWSPILALSGLILASGIGLYAARTRVAKAAGLLAPLDAVGPARAYDSILAGFLKGAKVQARLLQNGRLRVYLRIIFGVAFTAGLLTFLLRAERLQIPLPSDMRFHEVALAVGLVVSAIAIPWMKSRLGAVAVLGVTGYSIAGLFVLFGAPDLAITQFLFETLTVLIFIGVLRRMPRFTPRSPRSARVLDASLAVAGGLLVTLLVLAATTTQLHPTISSFYAAQSVVAAHGRNVVNVILVDFRALDTLGEITVLAVAALGVMALLRLGGTR